LMRTGAGTGAALGACADSGVVSATVNVRPSGVRIGHLLMKARRISP